MPSIKGKLFEFFVYKLLCTCNFRPVIPDDTLVYKGSAGLMVHGLGQPHNADVLLSPPIQTPFYYPSRLLVECKCYDEPIGLPVIRNALGLREDINNFDIVTEDILKNRRSPRSSKLKYYPMQRYIYQVAVASIDGFRSTAIPFALAHRIPLISFSCSKQFANIRKYIAALDNFAQTNEEFSVHILDFLKRSMNELHDDYYWKYEQNEAMQAFLAELSYLQERVSIGLLEDGTILFLIEAEPFEHDIQNDKRYNDGFSIHWHSNDESTWVLSNNEQIYYFELPKEIYDQWKSATGEQRRNALKIKRGYFSKIVLFNGRHSQMDSVQIIQLSEDFMREAEKYFIADTD